MKLGVILKLALRNLWSHRLRTTLTVAGVTIGIAAIIFLVSLGYGLEQLVTSQVANFNAFTVIDVPSASVATLKVDQQLLDKISAFGHIKVVAPVSNLAGRISKKDSASTAETVILAGNEDYWKLSDVIANSGQLPKGPDEVLINQSVINMIGASKDDIIGKTIGLDMIIPTELQNDSIGGLKVVENVQLKVVGLLSDDKSPVVMVTLDLLRKNQAAKYSALKIKVDEKANVDSIRKQVENIGFTTEYVGDTVSEIAQVFSLFRIILFAFGLIALIVAALGTFNTLTISLLERIREIGLFKALGMRNRDVYKLFLAESLIIGVFGGILGLAIGIFLSQGINITIALFAKRSSAEVIQLFVTPWSLSVGVAVFSILVGFLTGWYPSKRAVKIDPLDALRFE